jgi:nitroimidazol reductase NimA-like FMN-containing flavoprotein (pyridoxamine 5'-phosphate oxidase superfamily)
VPWRPLSEDEIDALLHSQRIVRVAFGDSETRYVVPLGYVWVEGALWGTTRRGKKIELAERDANVAFEVDDSATSTPFEWQSCLGEGVFEVVSLDEFERAAAPRMAEVFVDNPSWNRREWLEGLADGSSVCWRVQATTLSGRVPFDPHRRDP